ncbi:type II toxin-antitoxin system YafO family toxin (plasmid) [Acinetobacter johnsonii]|nr:type II toxin-antitoxin system YafO family toxin [Acinetobacter johnsonii]
MNLLAEDFYDYMFNSEGGFYERFHDSFGKDVTTDFPRDEMEANGLAHVHVFDEQSMTEEEISKWDQKNYSRTNNFLGQRGTSDTCVVYALGSEGTVLLLAFYAPPAHEMHDNTDYVRSLLLAANKYFDDQGGNEYVLPRSKLLEILAA